MSPKKDWTILLFIPILPTTIIITVGSHPIIVNEYYDSLSLTPSSSLSLQNQTASY